jgi:hypothetical protein
MKQSIVFLAFLLASLSLPAQSPRLHPDARISIITCGPHQGELYSAFGHSAIRVFDPSLGIDLAYNYGVFDFDQPNFYLNFARGYSYYKLAVYPYPLFRDHYISYNRYVHEQVLNLTEAQKQKIFDFLEWNAQPENASYLYDYFYDNCATRVRDVFFDAMKEDLVFDSTFIQTSYTIRQLTDLYLTHQPWGDLGIDICLGLPMDKKASVFEYMFLPDYIEWSFDHVAVKADSALVPFVKEKIPVYEARPASIPTSWMHPWVAMGGVLLLIATVSFRDWKRGRPTRWMDGLLFGTAGTIGLLLTLLWIATNHQAAAKNMNLLWAMPTHLIVLFFYFRTAPWVPHYFKIAAAVYGVLLVGWLMLPQQLHVFLLPLVAALFTRSALLGWWLYPKAGATET